MRNATYELAMPASPTSQSAARATASVVTFFATTEAATAISTVARTTTIAYVAIAVNASVKCSGMAIACSGRSARSNPNRKPQPRPKANPDRALTLPPTPTRPLTLALRLRTLPGPKPDDDPNHSTGLRVRWLDGGHDPLLRSTPAAHARRPGRGCLEPPSLRSSKNSNWTDDAATAAVCTAVRLQIMHGPSD